MTEIIPSISRPEARHLQANRTFQGIPSVTILPSGRLFAIWYGGGVGEGPDNFVMLAHSDDGGKNWSDAEWIITPTLGCRTFDPCLFTAPDGRLCLFWAQCKSTALHEIFDGKNGVWFASVSNPDASPEEFQFTTPVRISDGVMMNRPVVLSTGEWALPISQWNHRNYKEENPQGGAQMIVSSNNGQSFSLRGFTHIPKEIASFDEHSFYELPDHRLGMLIRIAGGFAEAFSSDSGKTWTPPVKSTIPGPDSRGFLGTLPSGRLLLVHNNDSRKRRNMTAALSDDGGKTWPYKLLLDARDNVSYPDAAIAPDESICLIYDHDRYNGGDILFSRITEADIEAGHLVSANSFAGAVVSHTRPVPR